MKYFLIICFTISCTVATYGQSLEGVWKGTFTYDGLPGYLTSVALNIQLSNTESYIIHSYTLLETLAGDTIIVSKVRYEKLGKRAYKLQEYQFLNGDLPESSMQTMFLDLKEQKGRTILTGRWESTDEERFTKKRIGRITLTKQ